MKRNRGNFGYVFFGVMLGIFISISILWWTGNNPFKDVHLFKNIKSYFSNLFKRSDDGEPQTKDSVELSSNKNPTTVKKAGKINPDSVYFDSTSIDFYDAAALDEFLASFDGKLPDSIKIDSFFKSQKNVDINSHNQTDNSLAVKKDKLLFSASYSVPGIDKLESNKITKADSLLVENSGAETDKNILKVEFWKSPVNYRGYKKSSNKVILFGINAGDKVSFKVNNNILYMKHKNLFYVIEKTYDFKSFVPVTNTAIITQLEK